METPLKKLRRAKKLTLEEVAANVGCHHSHLSRVENGGACSTELAEKLVQYFGPKRITELEILYPQRFQAKAKEGAAV